MRRDEPLRLAYADPPYIGCARLYKKQPDYAGEVDHAELARRLETYDGFVLHASSPSLATILPLFSSPTRIGAWVKPFCSFKPGVTIAYAWEPVIFRAARPRSRSLPTLRDWVSVNIELRRGLAGAKPSAVCRWCFELMGALPGDDLADLFPGTGAVTRAWKDFEEAARAATA